MKIKEIIDSMHDGIYITDNKGYTIDVNKAYTKLSGIEKNKLIGKHMNELIDNGYFLKSASLEVLEKKETVTIIDEFRDGKKCLVTSTPVYDENHNIIYVVTNVRDLTELISLKKKIEESEKLNEKYYMELEHLRKQQMDSSGMIAQSQSMKEVLDVVKEISKVDATVLILGETGVGKEVVAREIHKKSRRSKGPFIKLNCAAIPENLIESELFGYEKGAFTGAQKNGKPGMFELANSGTILLDEIGELPIRLQSKLLRVLQERELTRIGGLNPVKLDLRIIAVTNRKLEDDIEKGLFREDLYYRLNVIPIQVPPLRKRKEDIPLLATHFLSNYNKKYNKDKKISTAALNALNIHDWPGNIRELENLVERLVVICNYDLITEDYIINLLNKDCVNSFASIIKNNLSINKAVADVEKQLITKALKSYGTTRKAAEALGISQPTVVRKTKKYGIKI